MAGTLCSIIELFVFCTAGIDTNTFCLLVLNSKESLL